jgi:hypothetical protein
MNDNVYTWRDTPVALYVEMITITLSIQLSHCEIKMIRRLLQCKIGTVKGKTAIKTRSLILTSAKLDNLQRVFISNRYTPMSINKYWHKQ